MKELLFVLLLLWQLELAVTSSLPTGPAASSQSIEVRNRRDTSVNCAGLSDESTADVLASGCDQITSNGGYTLWVRGNSMDWSTFSAKLKEVKDVNFQIIKSNIGQMRFRLEKLATKEILIKNNQNLRDVKMMISQPPAEIVKLYIIENLFLSNISLTTPKYVGKSIEISRNRNLEGISFEANPMAVEELIIERNRRLEKLKDPPFNGIKKMKIRGNNMLSWLTLRGLKLERMILMDQKSDIQDLGECSFDSPISAVSALHGCNTVYGNLKIAPKLGEDSDWRVDGISGSVYLGDYQQEEGKFSFLGGAEINGTIFTDRCDLSNFAFSLRDIRPVKSIAKCEGEEGLGRQSLFLLIAGNVFLFGGFLLTGFSIFCLCWSRRTLKIEMPRRDRHFPRAEEGKEEKKSKPTTPKKEE